MTVQDVANELVALVREGKYDEAFERLYAPDIVSVEAYGDEREARGLKAVYAKVGWWAENFETHKIECSEPFINGSQFAVIMTLDVTPKATGQRTAMQEIAVYTVENDVIAYELFFYGPGMGGGA